MQSDLFYGEILLTDLFYCEILLTKVTKIVILSYFSYKNLGEVKI
jgi:hypothetical protein